MVSVCLKSRRAISWIDKARTHQLSSNPILTWWAMTVLKMKERSKGIQVHDKIVLLNDHEFTLTEGKILHVSRI